MNLFGDAMQAKQPGLWFCMDRSTTRGQQWCSKASKGEPLSERVRPDGVHTPNANLAGMHASPIRRWGPTVRRHPSTRVGL